MHSSSTFYAQNPLFEIVQQQTVKVYLHIMCNRNVQQNPQCVVYCVTKVLSICLRFSPTIFYRRVNSSQHSTVQRFLYPPGQIDAPYRLEPYEPGNKNCFNCVQMTLSRVIVEMVADGGGHFSPASYRWFTHMSLLFSTHTAHIRAVGTPHTMTNTERHA